MTFSSNCRRQKEIAGTTVHYKKVDFNSLVRHRSNISLHLPGRSENAVKNRWNSLAHKICQSNMIETSFKQQSLQTESGAPLCCKKDDKAQLPRIAFNSVDPNNILIRQHRPKPNPKPTPEECSTKKRKRQGKDCLLPSHLFERRFDEDDFSEEYQPQFPIYNKSTCEPGAVSKHEALDHRNHQHAGIPTVNDEHIVQSSEQQKLSTISPTGSCCVAKLSTSELHFDGAPPLIDCGFHSRSLTSVSSIAEMPDLNLNLNLDMDMDRGMDMGMDMGMGMGIGEGIDVGMDANIDSRNASAETSLNEPLSLWMGDGPWLG
jgi:hypothetical protein